MKEEGRRKKEEGRRKREEWEEWEEWEELFRKFFTHWCFMFY